MSGLLSPDELKKAAEVRRVNQLTDENAYTLEHIVPPLMERINQCLVSAIANGERKYTIPLYGELRKYSKDQNLTICMNEDQEMFLIKYIRNTFKDRDDVFVTFHIQKRQYNKPIIVTPSKTIDSNFDIIVSVDEPDDDLCVYYNGECHTRVTDFEECHRMSNCGECPYIDDTPPPPPPPTPPPIRIIGQDLTMSSYIKCLEGLK